MYLADCQPICLTYGLDIAVKVNFLTKYRRTRGLRQRRSRRFKQPFGVKVSVFGPGGLDKKAETAGSKTVPAFCPSHRISAVGCKIQPGIETLAHEITPFLTAESFLGMAHQ